MKKTRLNHDRLPENSLQEIAKRDSVLWIGQGFDTPSEIQAVCDLIQLPWRMVLCESSSAKLAQAIESRTQISEDPFSRIRGFIHLVASNPEGLALPPRS